MRTAKEIREQFFGASEEQAECDQLKQENERLVHDIDLANQTIIAQQKRVAQLEAHVCFKIREQNEQVAAAKIEGLLRVKALYREMGNVNDCEFMRVIDAEIAKLEKGGKCIVIQGRQDFAFISWRQIKAALKRKIKK